ncbi:MAG: hypothetical protein N2556_06105 [Anaerolineae bacterium]|nr:hypothetical protein [Anaerolineae bacterium]
MSNWPRLALTPPPSPSPLPLAFGGGRGEGVKWGFEGGGFAAALNPLFIPLLPPKRGEKGAGG